MELLYVVVKLADGKASVWSSSRGRIDAGDAGWRDVFTKGALAAGEPQAKAMIHLVGDDSAVSDEERSRMAESAKKAGYGTVRFETGAPMDPEEAFELMLLPFT